VEKLSDEVLIISFPVAVEMHLQKVANELRRMRRSSDQRFTQMTHKQIKIAPKCQYQTLSVVCALFPPSSVCSRQASLLTMSAKDETTSVRRPAYVPLGEDALQKLSKDYFGFTQAE
jgi:hypothetical protein